MGKQPVRLKAVVYSLSPFQQKTMSGLWNDLPGKIQHKISDSWIGAALLLGPLVGVYTSTTTARDKLKNNLKIQHKISDSWIGAALLLGPLVGVYTYVQRYQEKEKLEHRY